MPVPNAQMEKHCEQTAKPEPSSMIEKEKRRFPHPTHISAAIIMGLVVAIQAVFCAFEAYDNDMWFILATGREILENGIPYVNPFSMHEGMGMIVQQWLSTIIDYVVYETFGMTGMSVMVFIIIGVLVFSICQVARAFSRNKIGMEVVLGIIALAMPVLTSYISVRPQIYTMIAFCWILYACEKYRQTSNIKYLVMIPIIVLFHVNFHSSMAPFDLLIIFFYLIPNIKTKLFSTTSFQYARIPLLVALIASCIALCINPYAVKGALYVILSYGAAGYSDYIKEMGTFTVWSFYGFFMMIFVLLGAMSIGKKGKGNIDLPLTFLFLITTAMSFQHVRNVWLVVLFAMPLIFQMLRRARFRTKIKYLDDGIDLRVISGLTAIAIVIVTIMNVYPEYQENIEQDNASVPSVAMDYLDSVNADPETTKIFNFFNCGGYIEWRGYRVLMDPRPELWQPAITGLDREYYKEFVNMALNKTPVKDMVEEYDFDYFVANKNTKLWDYLSENESYEIAVNGNGYDLWKKSDSPKETINETEPFPTLN